MGPYEYCRICAATLLRGSRGSPATGAGKSSCLPSGMQGAPGEEGTDPLAAHPEVTRAKKGLQPGCPTTTVLPCAFPQFHLPPEPLQPGFPCPAPSRGGTPSRRQFPDSTVPGGDVCPNSEVGAIASRSSFLWERKGARCCVNKQPLPRAAPRKGRGQLGWGTPRGASSWDGGDSMPWGMILRDRLLFPDRPFNQPNSAWKKKKTKPKKIQKITRAGCLPFPAQESVPCPKAGCAVGWGHRAGVLMAEGDGTRTPGCSPSCAGLQTKRSPTSHRAQTAAHPAPGAPGRGVQRGVCSVWDSHITYMSPAASDPPRPQLQEPATGSHPTGKSKSESQDADTA